MLSRRNLLLGTSLLLAGGATAPARAEAKMLRVASQKGAGIVLVLKERGTLEQKLRPLGWSVTWTEFPAGPQLLESLNVGVTDFGLVGEGPPIFAQAAGADIVYVGAEVPAPKTEAIIVPKDSPIKTVADLKGKRVALNKGSDVNYLLIRAVEANGLTYKDIVPAYLTPADARAAFERGAVDAWVIWDPYYASAAIGLGARTLADGTGLAGNVSYYMARRPVAEGNPQIIEAALAAVDEIDIWARDHHQPYAKELAASLGIPQNVSDLWVARSTFGAKRVDAAILVEQQKIADSFAEIGLIPKDINVNEAIWKVGS
ncbi:MAG TPA: sulfonate ABC transporter substrate-binding protein [Acetobacteraceae bacterium]